MPLFFLKCSIENVMTYNLPHDGKRKKAVVQQRYFHTPIHTRRLLRDQSRRFFFIFSRNDAVSLLKAAAKGGSRHETHTVSTKSDCHWHIKKSPSTAGENYAYQYELSHHHNTVFNAILPVRIFCGRAFFAPFGFLKKLFGKRNKRAFSIRIGCERGRKDKPFVFYTTKEGGDSMGN